MPIREINTKAAVVAAALLAVVAWAGCSISPAPDANPCGNDEECPTGEFCASDGSCRQNCDPDLGQAECPGEKICSEHGRCIEAPCTEDGDCPTGQYCSDGTCEQDCTPQTGSGCGSGERCTERGRCRTAETCRSDDDCEDRPSTRCEGDTLVEPTTDGTCDRSGETAFCDWGVEERDCSYGCADGECLPNPCDGVSCDSPPAAECSDDGSTLVTYQTPGTCLSEEGGECDYQQSESSCVHGCSGGSCESGPCDSVTCEDPPPDECDGDVAVTYADTGSCEMTDDGTQCDYSPEFEHCLYTGAECSSASCTNPITQVGGVVITEYMANPEGREDQFGEWFEIENVGSSPVDLQGWSIASRGNPDHEIAESIEVGAGNRVVLAIDEDPAGDGSVTPDYVYSDVRMANGSDWIRLKNPAGDIVDHVFWEAGTIMAGHSRKLDPSATLSVSENDDFSNWCPSLESSEEFANAEDWGTPGSTNAQCASMPCSKYTCERPEPFCKDGDAVRPTQETASCEQSRFNNPSCDFGVTTFNCTSDELCAHGSCETIPSNVPDAGDVVVTELMGDPDAVDDTEGEWIELYNTTGQTLSLFSLVIEDSESGTLKDRYTVLNTNAEIPAGDYAVFAVETDPAKNGGVQDAYFYEGRHLKNTPGGLTIRLVRQDGTLVDASYYEAPTAGVSQQLSLDAYDSGATDPAAANDQAENWCEADSTYGDGDEGTPGSENRTCP